MFCCNCFYSVIWFCTDDFLRVYTDQCLSVSLKSQYAESLFFRLLSLCRVNDFYSWKIHNIKDQNAIKTQGDRLRFSDRPDNRIGFSDLLSKDNQRLQSICYILLLLLCGVIFLIMFLQFISKERSFFFVLHAFEK